MLVTQSIQGGLHSQPLAVADTGPDGSLSFSTAIESPKVAELEEDPRVYVVMQDRKRFVSVTGRASISRGLRRIEDNRPRPCERSGRRHNRTTARTGESARATREFRPPGQRDSRGHPRHGTRQGRLAVPVHMPTSTSAQVSNGLVDLSSEELLLRVSAKRALTISLEDVSRIEVVDRGKGMRDGFLSGALVGALVGAVVHLVSGTGCHGASSQVCNSTATSIEAFAVVGALLGGGFGVAVGASHGRRTIFTF